MSAVFESNVEINPPNGIYVMNIGTVHESSEPRSARGAPTRDEWRPPGDVPEPAAPEEIPADQPDAPSGPPPEEAPPGPSEVPEPPPRED